MRPAMLTTNSSEADAPDWSSLRYAPHDRIAPGGARFAPWWQRASAYLIDISAVLTAILTVAAPILVLAGFRDTSPSHREAAWFSLALVLVHARRRHGLLHRVRGPQRPDVGQAGARPRGARRGRRACGYGRATSRELLGRVLIGGFAWLLVLPGLLSYLAALWDPARQTWHDRIGQTIVVRVEHADPGALVEPADPDPDLTGSENAPTLTV